MASMIKDGHWSPDPNSHLLLLILPMRTDWNTLPSYLPMDSLLAAHSTERLRAPSSLTSTILRSLKTSSRENKSQHIQLELMSSQMNRLSNSLYRKIRTFFLRRTSVHKTRMKCNLHLPQRFRPRDTLVTLNFSRTTRITAS